MKKALKMCVFIVFWLPVAQAEELVLPEIEPITVNGLIAGKAVVMLNGKPRVLSVGEKVGNIELLEADQYSALLQIGDEQKRFYLKEARLQDYSDDFIAESDNLTQEQVDILASKVLVQAKSHIISIDLLERLEHKVRYRVEYFYNASHGQRASLMARTVKNGKPTGYSAHSLTSLEPGRHLVDIEIMMNTKAPESYSSDAVRFEIIGEKTLDGSNSVLAKLVPLPKLWSREQEQPVLPVAGNTVWKTGTR